MKFFWWFSFIDKRFSQCRSIIRRKVSGEHNVEQIRPTMRKLCGLFCIMILLFAQCLRRRGIKSFRWFSAFFAINYRRIRRCKFVRQCKAFLSFSSVWSRFIDKLFHYLLSFFFRSLTHSTTKTRTKAREGKSPHWVGWQIADTLNSWKAPTTCVHSN